MQLEKAVLRYVDERSRQGTFRGETPRCALSSLLLFADSAGSTLDVSKLTPDHVEHWLKTKKAQPSTKRSQFGYVRSFCKWLVNHDMLRANPCERVIPPKVSRAVPRAMPAEAVEALFKGAPDLRAEVVISLQVQEGLRVGEVARLEVGSIDFGTEELFVVGKGGHERVVPLTPDTLSLLRRYMAEYRIVSGPLIRSLSDPYKAATPNRLSAEGTKWMRDAGVKERGRDGRSPHALRHTCATDMARGGANIIAIQEILGHASIVTTRRYIAGSGHAALRQAIGGRSYKS